VLGEIYRELDIYEVAVGFGGGKAKEWWRGWRYFI
jgi:hypothetical protein